MRDGTVELVSRDQILRHARGQGNIIFPCSADPEQDWQPCPVDPYSANVMTIYTASGTASGILLELSSPEQPTFLVCPFEVAPSCMGRKYRIR